MKHWLESIELEEVFGISERAVRKRAAAHNWFVKAQRKDTGGKKNLYWLTSMQEDERLLVLKWLSEKNVLIESQDILPAHTLAAVPAICEKQQAKGMAKADLLRLYTSHIKAAGYGNKVNARKEFMHAYNSGIAYPKLFEIIGKVKWKTIEGWKHTLQKSQGDTFKLADGRGYYRRGTSSVTQEQGDLLLRCALHPNRPQMAEAIRMARAIMNTKEIKNGHSDATYRRWLSTWKSNNFHIWTFNREGAKAWNDKCAYYIERDYSLINVGDVIVADGHVLNFEILNPWTGKPKRMILILWLDMKSGFPLGWEIMPTEDTQAISSALRRVILRLGKYPKVAYLDNGKAFRARFFAGIDFDEAGFTGLYERLGVKTIFAWPYHGQSKTVERFFGSFAELERWCPTYSGTSIEKKPPRMMRGEKLHRRVYEKATGGRCITLEQAHMAVAAWFDQYVQRPQRGHLKGKAPVQLFLEGKGAGVDPAELRYLMMSMEIRHIQRNGIRFLGQNYNGPALYGRRHPAVIRYDLQDPSVIYAFETNGDFICDALPTQKVHPAATVLGTDEDREKLKAHIEFKRHQEKEASISARTFLEDEVMPEHKRMLAAMGVVDGDSPATVRQIKEPLKLTDAKKKQIQAEVRQLEALNQESAAEPDEVYAPEIVDETTAFFDRLSEMSEMDRYEKLIELEIKGQLIPEQWEAFMRYYEQTDEYMRYEDDFETHRRKMAMAYQVDLKDAVNR